jgi:hypothetical protein
MANQGEPMEEVWRPFLEAKKDEFNSRQAKLDADIALNPEARHSLQVALDQERLEQYCIQMTRWTHLQLRIDRLVANPMRVPIPTYLLELSSEAHKLILSLNPKRTSRFD